MSARCVLASALLATRLVLVSAVVATSLIGSVMAAKDDRKAGSDTPPPVIESIKGDKVKMAKARVADRVTRIRDAAADQAGYDGRPVTGAPAFSDIASVYMSPIRIPGKLLKKMADDFPRGAAGAFYGRDAAPAAGDRAVFVAVELAGKRPAGSVVQQVEVGLDGDAAGPVQVGSAADTRAGVERFSLSGLFSDGSESSGTTDVSGRQPGDSIDYYNTESRAFGFYDAKRTSYLLVMPLAADAQSVAVTLRTGTETGEVIDRLELPGGGHLIPLASPAGGFEADGGSDPLGCRSLETFSAASGVVRIDDPGATLIRYAAGADPALGSEGARSLLAALDAYDETVPLTLTPLDPAGEPVNIDARLTRAPALGAFTLSMEVPAGRWSFEAVEGAELLTPSGEALVDHASLTGRAGVLTGDGLDGFVSGGPHCARWDLGADACALLPADGLAALVGLDDSELEQTSLARPDGALWCAGKVPDTGEPQYVARFGTSYQAAGPVDGAEARCTAYPVDLGAQGLNLDCGETGYENYSFRVVPDATADEDPAGGLLVSVDMLVDGTKAHGDRYDSDAAMAVFDDIAATVAASARPAGASLAAAVTDVEPTDG